MPVSRIGLTPVSSQRFNKTSSATGSCLAMTACTPGRIIAAFSAAILSSVFPKYSSWSIEIGVMATTLAFAAVVESSRPPSPVSRIASSIPALLNASNAVTVNCSKNVGNAATCLLFSNWDETSRTFVTHAANSAGVICVPAMLIRSVIETRWGEV